MKIRDRWVILESFNLCVSGILKGDNMVEIIFEV